MYFLQLFALSVYNLFFLVKWPSFFREKQILQLFYILLSYWGSVKAYGKKKILKLVWKLFLIAEIWISGICVLVLAWIRLQRGREEAGRDVVRQLFAW